jgi:hypothetical protein
MPAIALPAAGVFTTRKDGDLLLLTVHIVLSSDSAGEPIDVLVLDLLEKFHPAFIILNRHIRITHGSGWPDRVREEFLLYETMELFLTDPYEEPEDISRIFLPEISEILFVSTLIEAIGDAAFLKIAIEAIDLKTFKIPFHDLLHDPAPRGQNHLPGPSTDFCRVNIGFSLCVFLLHMGLEDSLDQYVNGIVIQVEGVAASLPDSDTIHPPVRHAIQHQIHHMARDVAIGNNGRNPAIGRGTQGFFRGRSDFGRHSESFSLIRFSRRNFCPATPAVSDSFFEKGPFDTVIAPPEFTNVLHPQSGKGPRCLGLENRTEVDDLLAIEFDIP